MSMINFRKISLLRLMYFASIILSVNIIWGPIADSKVLEIPKNNHDSKYYDNSYAVIIGINRYKQWDALQYAVKDAEKMNEKLQEIGFKTRLLIDEKATRESIVKIMGDELPKYVKPNDRVLFFFAGHGHTEELSGSFKQMGYIIPYDSDKDNLYSTAISMEQIRGFSARLKAKHVLYIMDSCYSGLILTRSSADLYSKLSNNGDYIKKITSSRAHQIITAGQKGEQAVEEDGHGVFTRYILEALDGAADQHRKGYITFSDLVAYVRPIVSNRSRHKQTPIAGSIDGEGDFVFLIKDNRQISNVPDREKLKPRLINFQDFTDSYTGMEFVFIKGGCYEMGDVFDDGDKDEKPVHEVCVNDFYIGKYEVTQGEWEKLMDSNPSTFKGHRFPVEGISWNAAQQFILQLNMKSTLSNYRLPTEAEWEYAARSGGKKHRFSGTNEANEVNHYAWYDVNAGPHPRPVGSKQSNHLGLHDMSGNVWEWCQDWYGEHYYQQSSRTLINNPQGQEQGEYRVIRGGGWDSRLNHLRTVNRSRSKPGIRIQKGNGFRLVIPAEYILKKKKF